MARPLPGRESWPLSPSVGSPPSRFLSSAPVSAWRKRPTCRRRRMASRSRSARSVDELRDLGGFLGSDRDHHEHRGPTSSSATRSAAVGCCPGRPIACRRSAAQQDGRGSLPGRRLQPDRTCAASARRRAFRHRPRPRRAEPAGRDRSRPALLRFDPHAARRCGISIAPAGAARGSPRRRRR